MGGVYGGIVPLEGSVGVIVWCETGVFRFDPGRGVSWGYVDELVNNVQIANRVVEIDIGAKEPIRIDLDSGRPQ